MLATMACECIFYETFNELYMAYIKTVNAW